MCLVAVEDELSAAVVRRILAKYVVRLGVPQVVGQVGVGFLKTNLKKYLNAAKNIRPVFMLTDLDLVSCAPVLVRNWFEGDNLPSRFLFRVAVREVEAWLLADREAFGRYLGMSSAKIERNVETIVEPKEYLLNLAKGSKLAVRRELLPEQGAIASQGFGYNSSLCRFVELDWSPERASDNSLSLRRALTRTESWVNQL